MLSACPGEPPALPSLTLTARPTAIDDLGATSTLSVTAFAAGGTPGSGSVSITSGAGSLKAGTTLSLDARGHAETTFNCALSGDVSCSGRVPITAKWNDVTATTRVQVGDAGPGGGGGGGGGGTDGGLDGGSDAGAGDGGVDGGTDAGFDAGQPYRFDAGEVLLLGTLSDLPDLLPAIATLDAPSAPAIGLPESAELTSAQLSPDGRLIYLDTARGGLFAAVPDAFAHVGAGSAYPPDAGANDVALDTSACDGGSPVSAFWLRPDSTSFVYRCGSDLDYYENDVVITALQGRRLIALGHGGTALFSTLPFSDFTLDDAGVQHGIGGLMGANLDPLSRDRRWREVRATPSGGFLFTLPVPSQLEPCNIWRVTADGTATPDNTFVGLPGAAAATVSCTGRIDRDGVLYTPAVNATNDVVARRAPFPGAAAVVYTEAGASPSTFATFPPSVFTFVEPASSSLVTGP